MTAPLENIDIQCPYCGETMAIEVDCTAGDQTYYEDCQVCCAPIEMVIALDNFGNLLSVTPRREDD